MQGSLSTDELLGAVVRRDTGLRTARRLSHCFIMDVPSYPNVLIITDAPLNIFPTLQDKVDIVQNAIDLAHGRHGKSKPEASVHGRGGSALQNVRPRADHRRRA